MASFDGFVLGLFVYIRLMPADAVRKPCDETAKLANVHHSKQTILAKACINSLLLRLQI